MDPKLRAIIEQVKVDILTPAQEADNEAQLKEVSRSFFSDTITVPTKSMYEYAVRASVGDAVFREPCTSAFEEHMAQLTGKEAALFVSSGTLSNQLAIRTHLLQPPFSILTDVQSHINSYEAGGAAMHSGAYPIPVTPSNGHHLTLEDIKAKAVLGSDIHFAPTRLICLENTLNGMIFPQNDIIKIAKFARENDILMHLDGARLWHVAVETRLPLSELCAPFDSASLCLSKGLGAPIGTCLVGSKVFINKACWFRKAFGGGMRQTGILAASAAYALSHNFPQLPRVHALARRLQRGLEELGVGILCPAETCMVFFDPSTIGVEYGEVERHAAALPEPITLKGSRLVVHIQTTVEAIDDFLRLVSELRDEKVKEGFIPSTSQTFANGMTMNVYGSHVLQAIKCKTGSGTTGNSVSPDLLQGHIKTFTEAMSKSEREEIIVSLAARLFSAMLDDLVMDAALQGHREIARSRVECQICRTRCCTVHGSNAHALPQAQYAGSIEASSSAGKTLPNAGTSTPTTVKDGNVLFECTVCKRQIASNRYAPHLSSCMGIGTGVRRGTARATNLKTKIPIDSGRSASPYLGSENGNVSDDNSNEKAKGKSKGKIADEADFNLKRKRPGSPQISPVKKQKKQKTTGSPVSRLKAGLDGHTNQVSTSQSKVPSKLRSSSTASFLDRERSSTPGSQSSVGTPIGASTSPAISANSPAGTGPPKRGRPKGSKTGVGRGAAALMKRPSPPRPPPPPVRIEPDYLIDVEGEETGSSTDTDGS